MTEKLRNLAAAAALTFLILWNMLVLISMSSPIPDRHSFAFASPGGTSVSDFVHFYQCGYMTLSADRQKAYDPDVQLRVSNQLIAPESTDQVFYIQYVPFMFPLLAPLAVLPMPAAYTAWYIASLCCGLLAFKILCDASGKRFSLRDQAFIVCGVLASIAAVIALKIGQSSWFLLLFFTMTYLGLSGGTWTRNITGGVGLALVTIKPQYGPLLGVAALGAQRWRLVLVAVVTELLLLALAGFSIGWDNVLQYPAILINAETTKAYSGVNPEGMVSLRGLLSHFLAQRTVFLINVGALVIGAGALVYWWHLVRKQLLTAEWAMALTVVLCLMISPHSHVYDLLLLVIPAVLTLPAVGFMKVAELPSRSLKFWSYILMAYPVLSWAFYIPNLPSALFVINCLLLACGIVYCHGRKKELEATGDKA